MCINQPMEKTRAVCACNTHFPECDLVDAMQHITERSNPNHEWVYVHPEWRIFLIGEATANKE